MAVKNLQTLALCVANSHGVRVTGVAIAPGGKFLAHGAGGAIRLCEADTGKEIHRLQAPARGPASGHAASP